MCQRATGMPAACVIVLIAFKHFHRLKFYRACVSSFHKSARILQVFV